MVNWPIYTKDNEYKNSQIGNENDKSWQEDFYFVQGADPQFGMMGTAYEKDGICRKADWSPETINWDEEIRLAKLSVEKVNQLDPKPRFFIICGDLTHQMPGEFPKLKQKQIDDFKRVYSQVDPSIALICVCGNHDVGDTPTPKSIQKYRTSYGDDYFSFWCGGVLFIALNTQYYKDRSCVQELAEEQDKWLDEQLDKANGSPIVCFSHIPWFVKDVDEREGIFNIPLEWRLKVLEKLYTAGVRYMFCGHYHRNAGTFYKNDFEIIINSAIGMQLGDDKSGMRLVKVSKDKITHKYYDFESFPKDLNSKS
ncbi:serine/threonine-protein phosphatase CPPED1-like [Planococcus citri]|uniref:serine/threonine-protein phosphatase CPPED1-like n=1 Tax=Planococcus citri TaxID=170843 RepID=UPI0031F89D74